MAARQRNVAYKLWISQLLSGEYISSQDENNLSHLKLDNLNVVRVNIVGSITFSSVSDSYASAVLDDGSAAIRLKAWQQDINSLKDIMPGDLVMVVGKIREYNSERYVSPDLIKKLGNPNWLLLRQLELLKIYGFIEFRQQEQPKQKIAYPKTEVIQEERVFDSPKTKTTLGARNKVIATIDTISSSDGVTLDEIESFSKLSRNEVELAISELVKEGEIYYHKPGKLKLLQ